MKSVHGRQQATVKAVFTPQFLELNVVSKGSGILGGCQVRVDGLPVCVTASLSRVSLPLGDDLQCVKYNGSIQVQCLC